MSNKRMTIEEADLDKVRTIALGMVRDTVISRAVYQTLTPSEITAFRKEGFEVLYRNMPCVNAGNCTCSPLVAIVTAKDAQDSEGCASDVATAVLAHSQRESPLTDSEIIERMLNRFVSTASFDHRLSRKTVSKLKSAAYKVSVTTLAAKTCYCDNPQHPVSPCRCAQQIKTTVTSRHG